MNIIVAVDKNWAIGCRNELLVSIPADRKFFQTETRQKAVIMGRRTLESLPGGQPFRDRTNIVLTRKQEYACRGAVVVHSVEEALRAVNGFATEDVYVIGGASIYRQFLPYCEVAHVTKIDYAYQADAYFPDLAELSDWELTGVSEEQTYYDLVYEFCRYERRK